MLDQSENDIELLPMDSLGLLILADIEATREWSETNYLNRARERYRGAALAAITEALGWLRARVLISRSTTISNDCAIQITRLGRQVLKDGPHVFFVDERLQKGLHPLIEAAARPQFLLGKVDVGVFTAMREIEMRVRALSALGSEAVGVDLMNRAFGQKGVLTDPSQSPGEQEGTRALFAGTYALLRNPAGHRQVDFDDVGEAAEAVITASLLMRILDRVAKRLGK